MIPPRTTPALVQGLLAAGGDYDSAAQPDLAGYIASASQVVDSVVAVGAKRYRGSTMNLALQDGGVGSPAEIVERWLAAHFYCLSDKNYMARTTAGGSGTFTGQTAMGLDFTSYGQGAKTSDVSGVLTAIDKRQIAGAAWLGKGVLSQIPYWSRQ